jgi:FHA domain
MAKIVVSTPGAADAHHFVDKARLTIGRDPGCDIVLADASASKAHAVIMTVGLDHVVKDAGSRNGTMVNGTRIDDAHVLQNEDVIELGESRIVYRNRRASLEADLERTMIYSATVPGLAGHRTNAASVAVARAVRTRFPLASVRGLAGRHAGSDVSLERPLATFGERDVSLAVIRRRPHGYFIAHVTGAKHARVNDRALGNQPEELRPGDIIEVAGERLEFLGPR